MSGADNVWWRYMSGPSRLVDETVATLLSGSNVCLCVDFPLPYGEAYLRIVAEAMRGYEDMILDDALEPADNPGIYLIERFRRGADYRGNIPPAKFLLQQRALAGRLLPIMLAGEESQRWLGFIKSYQSNSIADGLFLVIAEEQGEPRTPKNVRILRYSDFVTEYDSIVFAGLTLSGAGRTLEMRRYITALAASIFTCCLFRVMRLG